MWSVYGAGELGAGRTQGRVKALSTQVLGVSQREGGLPKIKGKGSGRKAQREADGGSPVKGVLLFRID